MRAYSQDDLVNNISEERDLSFAEYMDVLEDVPATQKKMFLNEVGDKMWECLQYGRCKEVCPTDTIEK